MLKANQKRFLNKIENLLEKAWDFLEKNIYFQILIVIIGGIFNTEGIININNTLNKKRLFYPYLLLEINTPIFVFIINLISKLTPIKSVFRLALMVMILKRPMYEFTMYIVVNILNILYIISKGIEPKFLLKLIFLASFSNLIIDIFILLLRLFINIKIARIWDMSCEIFSDYSN